MANVLKGKPVADKINLSSKEILSKYPNISLATIRVGENKDDIAYENNISKRAQYFSINHQKIVLEENVDKQQYLKVIEDCNKDENIAGILLLNQPYPNDSSKLLDPIKDIDACSPLNLASAFLQSDGYYSCTAQAVMELLDFYNIDVKGKKVAVVGRSKTVGRPLSMMLLNKDATVVICHSKSNNLEEVTKSCDIVVAAVGRAEFFDKSYFKEGQTVIDVGINYSEAKSKIVGDVLFDDVVNLVENITPVPLGIGSITTSVLFQHLAIAARRINNEY